MDPFKDVWREDFEREVNEALGALDKSSASLPALGSLSESVIPKAATLQELESTREKLGSLENTLSELRRRHELRSRQLEEELRRRDRLKDVIIRLNMSLRRLERDGEESVRKIASHEADSKSLAEQLRESQEQRQALEDALSSEKEQGLQARLKSDELQARLENLLLRLESKENALKSLQARLEQASHDSLRTQAEQEAGLNSLRRELVLKDAEWHDWKLRQEGAEARFNKEKTEWELASADLSRRLERSEEQARRGEEALAKAVLEESRLRERVHQDGLELQSMKARMEAALAAGQEAVKTQEDLRRYEAELNERVLEKMKSLREERSALLAEADAAMRQAQEIAEQGRAALERAQRSELEAAHEGALAHEAVSAATRRVQEDARRAMDEARRLLEEERVKFRRDLQSAQDHARRTEEEAARKEAELLSAVQADRSALEARLRGSYERLRQEEAAARQYLEAEGSRLRGEAEAALREAHKIEEERAAYEADRLKAVEIEKASQRTISEITLERARLEAALEQSAQESRKHQFDVQSQQELRAVLERRVAELLAALSQAEGRFTALQSQPSALRTELEEAKRSQVALEKEAAELRQRLQVAGASIEAARQLEQSRHAEMERLQASQRLEIERLQGSLADAGAARARLETRIYEEGRAGRLELETLSASHKQETARLEKSLSEAVAARARVEQSLGESGALRARLEQSLAESASAASRLEARLAEALRPRPAAIVFEPEAPPSRAPSPPRRRWAAALAACALAIFMAAGAGVYWRERNKTVSLRVPFSHPTALVWQGDTLWAADWYEEAVYRMKLDNGKLKVVRRYVLPGVHITGMAVGDGALFLADSWKREIQRRVMDDTLSLESSLPSPGPNPIGLYFDGKYLWTADGTGTIYQQIPDLSLTVLNAYPSNYPAVAIDADEDKLWTADSRSRLIYARRRDEDLTILEALGLGALDSGKQPLSCFARRDRKLWIGRDGSNAILEVPWRRLESRPIPPHRSK